MAEAQDALSLGNAYSAVSKLRDLDEAERWFERSLGLRAESDRLGRATSLGSIGSIALRRFDDANTAGETEPVLLKHLNAAERRYQQALELFGADDHENRAITEHQLGNIYNRVGDSRQALRHYQQAIKHDEARGAIYEAGRARYNVALVLADDGQYGNSLLYARAALGNLQQVGPGAAAEADRVRWLIAELEQRNR
ncbi:MAG: tetratricopeptide repeat protein [Chloroflexota bacterium]